MKSTKFNIALALTIGLIGANCAFADEFDAIKPIACTSKSCNQQMLNSAFNKCDSCTSLSKAESKNMNQTYSHPYAIYGTNSHVGENNNGVTVSSGKDDNYGKLTNSMSKGVPLADSQSENITGAASSMPVLDPHGIGNLDSMMNDDDDSGNKIRIETPTSQRVLKRSLQPYYGYTGGAASIRSMFYDVSNDFWATPQINKLAKENVVAGYPNNSFKPNSPITRAEFASLLVRGMNLEDSIYNSRNYNFKDVPKNHWAYNIINAAKSNDLMSGDSNNKFKPNATVSNIDAMSMLAVNLSNDMSEKQANEILSKYNNSNNVPTWARKNVAKVIEANALEDIPNSNKIFNDNDITRAEVASMLDNIRINLGYSNADDKVAQAPVNGKYVASEEIVTVPTLKLMFKDIVSAHSATVGEQFAATTLDDVTIDGVTFKAGATVRGKVSEVVRPTKDSDGAIKLSFETIQDKYNKMTLPKQVLAAQVNQIQQPNFGVRLAQMPFTWVGGLIGNAGRMVGGAAISVSNAAEQALNGLGMANGELLSGNFKASGRSLQDVGKTIVKAPIDMTRTAIAGTIGVFQETGGEIAYLVDYNGKRISTIKPKQEVTISFGCYK